MKSKYLSLVYILGIFENNIKTAMQHHIAFKWTHFIHMFVYHVTRWRIYSKNSSFELYVVVCVLFILYLSNMKFEQPLDSQINILHFTISDVTVATTVIFFPENWTSTFSDLKSIMIGLSKEQDKITNICAWIWARWTAKFRLPLKYVI